MKMREILPCNEDEVKIHSVISDTKAHVFMTHCALMYGFVTVCSPFSFCLMSVFMRKNAFSMINKTIGQTFLNT